MAPWVRPGYMPSDRFAEHTISSTIMFSTWGRPWPPNSVGQANAVQPPSANWR